MFTLIHLLSVCTLAFLWLDSFVPHAPVLLSFGPLSVLGQGWLVSLQGRHCGIGDNSEVPPETLGKWSPVLMYFLGKESCVLDSEIALCFALGQFSVALCFRRKEFFFSSVQFSSVSVAQSCPTLCNPMNRSTPGLPVHHQFFLCAIIKCKVHLVYKPNCIFINSSQEWCPVFPSAYVFQHSILTQFKGLIVLPVKADVWGTRVVIFSAPVGFVGWSDWQDFGVDMSSLLSFFYSMESVWGTRTAWLSSHWCLAKGESNLPILTYCGSHIGACNTPWEC